MPPTRLEQFSVYTRPLTDAEMDREGLAVERSANIWYDEPGLWPTYEMFVAYQIGKATLAVGGGLSIHDVRKECERLIRASFLHCAINPKLEMPLPHGDGI